MIQALLLDNGLLEEAIKKSNFQPYFKPAILGLVKQLPTLIGPMLASTSDAEIERGLREARDVFIPFLLGEEIRVYEDTLVIEAVNENPPGNE